MLYLYYNEKQFRSCKTKVFNKSEREKDLQVAGISAAVYSHAWIAWSL